MKPVKKNCAMYIIFSSLNLMAAFGKKNNYTNIILDMDETLLGYYVKPRPVLHFTIIARPHLREFLGFCFKRFERVSIWTAAEKYWYDRCYKDVLKPNLPEGKSFHFVRARSLNKTTSHNPVKRLTDIYKAYPDLYNSTNTLIVDDNPFTYVENLDNAIPIQPFLCDYMDESSRKKICETDTALLETIQKLEKLLDGDDDDEIY